MEEDTAKEVVNIIEVVVSTAGSPLKGDSILLPNLVPLEISNESSGAIKKKGRGKGKKKKAKNYCRICNIQFNAQSSYSHHNKSKHKPETHLVCQVCNKSFPTAQGLKRHERVHTGERPYECLTCNKTFANRANLDQHQKTHLATKAYECVTCLKTFSHRKYLKQHQKSHLAEEDKPYICHRCGYRYSSAQSLKKHVENKNQQDCGTRGKIPDNLKVLSFEAPKLNAKNKPWKRRMTHARRKKAIPVIKDKVTNPEALSLTIQACYCGASLGKLKIIPIVHEDYITAVQEATNSSNQCPTARDIINKEHGYLFPEEAADIIINDTGVPSLFARQDSRFLLKQHDQEKYACTMVRSTPCLLPDPDDVRMQVVLPLFEAYAEKMLKLEKVQAAIYLTAPLAPPPGTTVTGTIMKPPNWVHTPPADLIPVWKNKLEKDKLAADKLAEDKLAEEKLAEEELAAEKLAAEKLAAEKLENEDDVNNWLDNDNGALDTLDSCQLLQLIDRAKKEALKRNLL